MPSAPACPLLIAPGESRVEAILDVIDALVLSGGGDIDPSRYDGKRHDTHYSIDQERDTLELELARRVIDSSIADRTIFRMRSAWCCTSSAARAGHAWRQTQNRITGKILGREQFDSLHGTTRRCVAWLPASTPSPMRPTAPSRQSRCPLIPDDCGGNPELNAASDPLHRNCSMRWLKQRENSTEIKNLNAKARRIHFNTPLRGTQRNAKKTMEQEYGNALDAKNAVEVGPRFESNAHFEAEDGYVPEAAMA
jgi:hypothetical protein